jgi:hypothetical protein
MLSTVDGQQTTAHRSKLQLLFSLATRVNGLTIESKKPISNGIGFFDSIFRWNYRIKLPLREKIRFVT